MKYATVCSGIEAPSVAWHGLGWKPVWFSEIERFPSAVLKHHYPEVPNLGDMTKINEDERYQKSRGSIDVFCGGTPCQSFSVAGLRKGMDDPRGNLALHFLRIANEIRPRWIVWENVPGVLSSNGGRDFGSFLGALGQLGYGWAYRVLDAQYFGVAQRRRRVFVVGYIGGWRGAAAVLFDTESLSGNTPPGREAGKRIAGTISSRTTAGGGLGTDFECGGGVVAPTLQSGGKAAGSCTQQDAENGALVTGPITAGICKGPRGTEAVESNWIIKGAAIGRKPENGPQYGEILEDGSCYTLNCTEQHAVAFAQNQLGELRTGKVVNTINTNSNASGRNTPMVFQSKLQLAVRRLTPRECERLQGFSDGYTKIPYRGKPASQCPDGPRYKALGNSMAVPVMAWLGRRIQQYEDLNL